MERAGVVSESKSDTVLFPEGTHSFDKGHTNKQNGQVIEYDWIHK